VALEEHGRQFMAEERLVWYEMEEKRAANDVTELAANKEAARQHAALATTLEAEEAARMWATYVAACRRRRRTSATTKRRWRPDR
jgi:cyclopropane fatty-acyl-phospholipid synthase-like methyltransferase